MVTIGGNEHGSAHPASSRSPLLAKLAGTLAATALIASTGASALAAGPNPKTASQVAVVSAGPGANINGSSLSSIEVFPAGSLKNASPSQYDHGSATNLVNPSDIKYSPGFNFFAVANSSTALLTGNPPTGGTFIFAANANGNQGPVQKLFSASTYIPAGVSWDDDGDLWVSYFSTPSCLFTPPGPTPATGGPSETCTTGVPTNKPPTPPSEDLCAITIGGKQIGIVGTIEEFVPNGSVLTAPNVMLPIPVRTIKSCGAVSDDPNDVVSSGLFAPIGIAVTPDKFSVQVCVGGDEGPEGDPCAPYGGTAADIGYYGDGVIKTHAVFVANSAAQDITVYEPELEEEIRYDFGAGEGLITENFGTYSSKLEAMAPLGGTLGAGFFNNPQFIAFGPLSYSRPQQLLVTDANGGPFLRGSIVNLPTYKSSQPFCAQPFGHAVNNYCDVFVLGAVFGQKSPTFIEANPKKGVKDVTGLHSPEGIATLLSSYNTLQQIFVADPLTGSFYQYAANASGNAAPQTTVGGNTNISKMVSPWGLTIMPPPPPPPPAVKKK